jgi:hypothetical protein
MTDRDARLSPDFSYETLIARANAEHAEAVHHPLAVVREFVHSLADGVLHPASEAPETPVAPEATADEAYLADARSYADLRGRFNDLATRHNDIPLDPGP